MTDSTFFWATVTAVGPLRVQLDGDTAALPITLDSLVDPLTLAVSDRVRCELAANRVIVHGRRVSGSSFYSRRNKAINGDFRVNQRGYTTGTALTDGAYGFDRWKAVNGVTTNLYTHPSFEGSGIFDDDNPGILAALAYSTTQSYRGPQSVKIQRTSTGGVASVITKGTDRSTVAALTPYTGSIYVLNSSASARTVDLWLRFYNPAGTTESNSQSYNVVPPGVWTRLVATGTPAAGETQASLNVRGSAVGSSVGDIFYIDAAQIEAGSIATEYLDGSLTSSDYTYAWASTAHASTSTRTARTSLAFASAPQGQQVTVNASGIVRQTVERADIPAGTWALSWSGTARARVYNAGATAPAWAAGGLILVTLDGTDDVRIEFAGLVTATGTLSLVQLEQGAAPSPFEREPLQQALARCQRHYQRWECVAGYYDMIAGFQTSTTSWVASLPLPVEMRAVPAVSSSGMYWSDEVTFRSSTSPGVGGSNSSKKTLMLAGGMTTSGAQYRPGVLSTNGGVGLVELSADL